MNTDRGYVPPLKHQFDQKVRVGCPCKETKIDKVIDKIITNKVHHQEYDPYFADRTSRKLTIKSVLYASELSPYRKYIDDKDMMQFVE